MRLPEGEYHSHPAISFHKLKDFEDKGGAYYKAAHIDKTISQPITTSMRIGTAFHALTLEGPLALGEGFAVEPEDVENDMRKLAKMSPDEVHLINEKPNRRTNVGKEEWKIIETAANGKEIVIQADWDASRPLADLYNSGKFLLSREQMALIHDMADAVAACPDALAVLDGCTVEDSWFAQINVPLLSGDVTLDVRGRVDAWKVVDGVLYIVDLKSCASLAGFHFDVGKFSMYRQVDFYATLAMLSDEVPDFHSVKGIFLACEKGNDGVPSRCQRFDLHESYLEIGGIKNNAGLRALAAAYETDTWPRNPKEIITLTPKRYEFSEDDSDEYQ